MRGGDAAVPLSFVAQKGRFAGLGRRASASPALADALPSPGGGGPSSLWALPLCVAYGAVLFPFIALFSSANIISAFATAVN